MLQTRTGSEDGKNVRKFIKDNFYNMERDLARVFILQGVATEVLDSDQKATQPQLNKAITSGQYLNKGKGKR